MRPRPGQKKQPKAGCIVTVQSLFKYISKLLDASDLSEKAASQLYLFSERRLIEYADACRSFQRQLSILQDEKEVAVLALERERVRSQQLGEEAQKLQSHLDIIRQVLRDSDLDQAKQRLAQLDFNISDWPPTSPGNRRREHSAGSLLDPGNASSGSDTGDSSALHTRPHSARKSASASRRKSKAIEHPETLRRSTRLSANRQSVTFLDDKSGNKSQTESYRQSLSNKPTDSGIARKRTSSESTDSYHDVLFKPSPLVGGLPLLSDEDGVISIGGGLTTTDDSTSLASMNAVFGTTPNASVTGSFVKSGSKKRKRLDTPVTGSRLTRPHNFVSRSMLHFETCSCCGKKVTFGKQALKCNACRLVVHASCRNQLKQPCVPVSELSPSPRPEAATPMMKSQSRGAFQSAQTPMRQQTPLHDRHHHPATTPLSSATKRQTIRRTLKLANCCPLNEFPQVPAIVIHCVTEVATRGLQQVGLYRISGGAKQVQELYLKFMHGRVTPSLALVNDINVICSCLKMFLSALDEPLVTYAHRPEFAEVAKLAESEPEVFKFRVAMILDRLPPVYRDTLSYLMLHLKTVSRSPACRMGEDNLARVFGPTIVGYSSSEPTPMQVASEIPTQQSVVRLLFSVPDSVFSTVLNSFTGSGRSSCQSGKSGSSYFQPLPTSVTVVGSNGDSTTMPASLLPTTTTHNDVTTQGRFFEKLFSRNRD